MLTYSEKFSVYTNYIAHVDYTHIHYRHSYTYIYMLIMYVCLLSPRFMTMGVSGFLVLDVPA